MEKIENIEKEAILYITLAKMQNRQSFAEQNRKSKRRKLWKGRTFFGKEAEARNSFCFSKWGSRSTAERKRLQCSGGLDNTQLIIYEMPFPFTMLQESSRLQKKTRQQIARILQECDDTCTVLYEEKLKECLALQPQIAPFFYEGMVQEMMLRHSEIEEVWIIDGGEPRLALLQTIYDGLNRLTIITEQPAAYEEFIQEVYEDTGLVAVCMTQMSEEGAGRGLPLVIDMGDGRTIPHRKLPQGALYIDLCPDCFKRRSIQLKRSDVHYADYWKFLDSCVKSTV